MLATILIIAALWLVLDAGYWLGQPTDAEILEKFARVAIREKHR